MSSDSRPGDKQNDGAIEPSRGRPLSAEEQYFHEQAYKEPVESIARIEEVAKFLVGATATTSGLFLAAFKLVLGKSSADSVVWLLPFVAWSMGIVALMLVLFPQRYGAGRNQPASWKEAFLRARRNKYVFLCVGAMFFVVGVLLALVPLGR
jgi:hypothetical protein